MPRPVLALSFLLVALVAGLLGLVAAALAVAIVVENMLNRRMRLNEVLRLGEGDG